MTRSQARMLYWSPRILCILFALFVSVFALDEFGPGHTLGRALAGFGMHLLTTTGVLLVILLLAWRWAWIGAVLFLGLGVAYCATGRFDLSACLLIGGPLILLGGLFLLNWVYRRQLRGAHVQPG